MSVPKDASEALERFSACSSWEGRARLLMQEGDRLPSLAADECTDATRIHGCESQLWLLGHQVDGHWQFRASSDARLLRGLLALLLMRVNGLNQAELLEVDITQWFADLGLQRQLTPSRSNGLHAVLQRMRALAG